VDRSLLDVRAASDNDVYLFHINVASFSFSLYVAIYRDVPKPDELGNLGNMKPHLADNAEALVDWALSHVPPKAGPRKSRHKKRVQRRLQLKLAHHALKKQEVWLAGQRRREKNLRDLKEIQKIKADAKIINAEREAKLRAAGLLRERLTAN